MGLLGGVSPGQQGQDLGGLWLCVWGLLTLSAAPQQAPGAFTADRLKRDVPTYQLPRSSGGFCTHVAGQRPRGEAMSWGQGPWAQVPGRGVGLCRPPCLRLGRRSWWPALRAVAGALWAGCLCCTGRGASWVWGAHHVAEGRLSAGVLAWARPAPPARGARSGSWRPSPTAFLRCGLCAASPGNLPVRVPGPEAQRNRSPRFDQGLGTPVLDPPGAPRLADAPRERRPPAHRRLVQRDCRDSSGRLALSRWPAWQASRPRTQAQELGPASGRRGGLQGSGAACRALPPATPVPCPERRSSRVSQPREAGWILTTLSLGLMVRGRPQALCARRPQGRQPPVLQHPGQLLPLPPQASGLLLSPPPGAHGGLTV